MASWAPLSSRIRFGAFDLNAASGELRKSGIPIKLRFQAIEVLLMLTERAGHVVTREEIRQRLWTDDTFVDFERSINFCINQIRAALGDDAEKPRYVETLPRRGYRFIAPVTVEVSRHTAPIVTIAPPASAHVMATDDPDILSPASSGMEVVPPWPPSPRTTLWTRTHVAVLGITISLASVAVGFATHKWLTRNKAPSLQDLRITKLTNNGGITGVAISPDGRYAAYAKLEGERQDLWLRQIAAQNDVQILSPGTGFHGLTFSLDGNYVYFVRSDERNPYFKYLYSMPTLGGPVRKLLTDVDSPVSFAPDGRRFVYEHCVEGRDDIELRIANADGGDDHLVAMLHNATSLLFQPGPSWSPDGHTIAVPARLVGPRSEWVLEVVVMPAGNVRELFSRPDAIGRPVWLQGDSLLVPLYDAVGRRGQLWTITFPEGKARRFTNDLTSYGTDLNDYGFPLDATTDRKSLVALATTRVIDVWVAPFADPAKAEKVTKNAEAMSGIVEAKDGRLWAVTEEGQLWIMNPDGGQGAAYGEYHDIHSLAACGRFMILAHGEAGPVIITRLDEDGRHPTDLVTGSFFAPFCSPNGNFVYYGSAEQPQKIWRVPVQGGVPAEIAKVLGDQISGAPRISPDGSLISYAYTKFGPSLEWNVAVIPAEGGLPRQTMPIPPIDGAGPYWSPDGKALQYLWTRNGVTNIWEQSLSGGKPKQLTKFSYGRIFGFSRSFDHKRLLLMRGEIRSDAVLLSNLH